LEMLALIYLGFLAANAAFQQPKAVESAKPG
jgi:hypothetical protein